MSIPSDHHYIFGLDAFGRQCEDLERRFVRERIAAIIAVEVEGNSEVETIESKIAQDGIALTAWDRKFVRRQVANRPTTQ